MDAPDGASSRRDSVSHAQPVIYDSPCRRTAREPVATVDTLEAVEAPTQAAMASAAEPIDQDRTQAYAFEQDRKHVSTLLRQRSRSKSHRPRQSSRSDSTHPAPVSTFSKASPSLSDSEIDKQLLELLEQDSKDPDMAVSYAHASPVPPVTAESLSELDIARIINNPKLRHDVNFDKELHFRPNLDGSRGKQKLRAADDFWKALVAELILYQSIGAKLMSSTTPQDAAYWTRMMASSQKRLPVMFETIRDILKTLVPERDQSTVAERLDVAMIMQEISRGLFDMMSLAQWLSTLLKAHCAPMRDEWIDQMVVQVQKGNQANSQKLLIAGLRQLLAILEAMKLDVANHQIRHLRVLLIDDGVSFQQKYHLSRVHYGRLDTARSRKWFLREYSRHLAVTPQPDKIRVFVTLLAKSLLSSHLSLPETFSLDVDRLRVMRTELHNHIFTSICGDVFDSILRPDVSEETRLKAKNEFLKTLPSIVGDNRKFSDCASNIAVEAVRQALEAERSEDKFDADRTDLAEHRLKSELSSGSFHFGRHARQMYASIAPRLEKMIRENLPLTPLTLHDRMSAANQQAFGTAPAAVATTQQPKSIDAVLKRVCHVAVLHWHIWSPMVYDVTEQPGSSDSEGSCASVSASDSESETGSDAASEISTPKI